MSLARQLLSILAVASLALLVAGCGSSDDSSSERTAAQEPPTATATAPAAPPGASVRSCEGTVGGAEQVRVTGVGCDAGRSIAAAWTGKPSCLPGNEASRVSCSIGDGYRCLGASVERGIAVSCAAPGRSVAFVAGQPSSD